MALSRVQEAEARRLDRVRQEEAHAVHPATQSILKFFEYEHLPEVLQGISKPFGDLAFDLARELSPSAELTTCLRKLLEAKDCAVRAAI